MPGPAAVVACASAFSMYMSSLWSTKPRGLCFIYRLCACPLISDIYVVEGPKACLANEEVSLGRFLGTRRTRLPIRRTECFWLVAGGLAFDIHHMSKGRDYSLDCGYPRMSHVGLALEHLWCQEPLWLTQLWSVRGVDSKGLCPHMLTFDTSYDVSGQSEQSHGSDPGIKPQRICSMPFRVRLELHLLRDGRLHCWIQRL